MPDTMLLTLLLMLLMGLVVSDMYTKREYNQYMHLLQQYSLEEILTKLGWAKMRYPLVCIQEPGPHRASKIVYNDPLTLRSFDHLMHYYSGPLHILRGRRNFLLGRDYVCDTRGRTYQLELCSLQDIDITNASHHTKRRFLKCDTGSRHRIPLEQYKQEILFTIQKHATDATSLLMAEIANARSFSDIATILDNDS